MSKASAQTRSSGGEALTDEPAKPVESLLAQAVTGKVLKPPRILIYGVHGVGKSTFAADAPAPIFIQTEEGANELEVAKLPTCTKQEQVMDYLRALYKDQHSYETIVIDSVDWLEDAIRMEMKDTYTDKELAFGKDSLIAEERIGEVLSALNLVLNRRHMTCILIAHSEIKRFDSPLTEPYDRYQPKLQQRFSALLQEWADAVLFAGYDVTVTREDVGFNKEHRRGVSSGERIIYTEERPGYLAKNRYGMPDRIPLLRKNPFAEFAQWVPYLQEKLGLATPEQPQQFS